MAVSRTAPRTAAAPSPQDVDFDDEDLELDDALEDEDLEIERELAEEEGPGDAEGPAEGDESASGDAAPADDEPDAPAGAVADDAAQQRGAASPPASPAAQAPNEEDLQPFSVRVYGKPVSFSGAVATKDHVVIPRETWQREVQPMLVDRGEVLRREATYRTQLQELQQQLESGTTESDARAEALIEAVDALISDPAMLQAFLADPERGAEHIRLRAENAVLKGQTEGRIRSAPKAGAAAAPQEQELSLAELDYIDKLDDYLGAAIARLQQDPAYRGIPVDVDAIKQHCWRNHQQMFVVAQEGNPWGVPPGTPVVNERGLRGVLDFATQGARQIARSKGPQARAAARNAGALGRVPARGSAAPASARTRAPATPARTKGPRNRQEWLKSLNADDDLELD